MNGNIAILRLSEHLYGIFSLLVKSIHSAFKRPYYLNLIFEQMDYIGVRSLPIVFLTSLFTGMVLAFQSGYELERFGSKMYVGSLVCITMVRELGPVLTGTV